MPKEFKIVPNPKCKNCIYRFTENDPAFIVNGNHYYCIVADNENECIDGYWHDFGECEYFIHE